jgi:hypothetical protein
MAENEWQINRARQRAETNAREYPEFGGERFAMRGLASDIQTLVWDLVAWRMLGVGPIPNSLPAVEFTFRDKSWSGVLVSENLMGNDSRKGDETELIEIAKAALHESNEMVDRLLGRQLRLLPVHKPEHFMWKWCEALYEVLNPTSVSIGKFSFVRLPCNVFYASALAIEKLIQLEEPLNKSAKAEKPTAEPATDENPKLADAIEFIKASGPVKGELVANKINVKLPTFRTHYVKKLRTLGIVSGKDGYCYDPNFDTSRDG